MIDNYWNKLCMFLETLSDETVALFKTNIPYGGSPEDMVKIYLLCGGLS